MSWFRRKREVVPFTVSGTSPGLQPLTRTLVHLMREYPGNWGSANEGYTVTHLPSGLTVWIANDDYGIAIWRGPSDRTRGPSDGFKPPAKDRAALYEAYQALAHAQLYHAVRQHDPAALSEGEAGR